MVNSSDAERMHERHLSAGRFFLRNDRDAIDRLILLMFGARGRHPRMAGARGSRPVIPYFALQQVPAGYRASVKKRGTTVVVQIGAAAA